MKRPIRRYPHGRRPGNPTPGSPQNQPTAQGGGSGASGPNPAEGQGSPKPTSAAINSDDDVLSSNETKLKRRLNEFDRLMDEQEIPQRAKGSQGTAQSSAQPSGSPSASTGSTSESEGASPEGQSAATADGQEGNPQDGSPSGSTTDGSENPSSSEQELGRSLAEFDQTLDDAASSDPLAKVDIQAVESTSVGQGSRETGSESPVSGTQPEATDPSDEVADSGDEESTDITTSGTGGSGPKDGTVEDDVAQNAAGFAFELALETISPVIAETMSKLRALAQWVNSQNLDSCETAQALVGAVWSKNDRASAAICAAVGTRQGIFSDYAAARHGCGADGKRNSTLAAASGPLKDQIPVNVNYAWRAVRASALLGSDRDLGEFAMSVSGTVIVTAPVSDADASGPRVRVLEPLALDRRVTEILMEGGGDLPVYRCDTASDCLNPTLGRLTVPAARGFRNRVADLLRRLVEAVRTDTAPPADALALVNLTTLPVYRVVNTAAAYRGAVVEAEVDSLAEAVALDVLQVWISDPPPDGRGARRDPRHCRRRPVGALARGPPPEPRGAGAPPPPGASAVQHRAGRGREAEAHRDRTCRSAVRGPPLGTRLLPRSDHVPVAAARFQGRAAVYETLHPGRRNLPGGPPERGGRHHRRRRLPDAGAVGRGLWARLGALPHRVRRLVEGQRQVDASLHGGLGRHGGSEGRPCGWWTGSTRHWRPAVVANVPIGLALFASVTSQVGDGLTRLTEQAFSLAERSHLPPARAHLRRQARGRGDPHGGDRRCVRPEPPGLRAAVRVPRAPPGPHLRGRSSGEHGHLAARHRQRARRPPERRPREWSSTPPGALLPARARRRWTARSSPARWPPRA